MRIIFTLTNYFYFIPIPPILPITIAFICGIITQAPYIPLCIIAFVVLIGALYIPYSSKCITIALLCISCACGSFLLQKNVYDHEELHRFINKSPITLHGTVINKNKYEKKWIVLEIAIDTITKDTVTRTCNKSALLYSENNTDLCVGDVCTFVQLKCNNPNNQNFTKYLIKEQIAFIACNKQFTYENLNRPYWSLRRLIYDTKIRLLESLQNKFSPETFRFFTSLFLGNRACIKTSLEKTNEQFKIWGISHFLARSGLHLALFILIWQMFFSYIPISFTIKQFLLTILSAIYFMLTWTSAPFTRAFALFMMHKLFLYLKIQYNLLHAISFVCLCFLIYCPLYLFFLDFQLSFVLTFALIWFNQLYSVKSELKY